MGVCIGRSIGTFETSPSPHTKGNHVVAFAEDLYKGMIHDLFQDTYASEVGALSHNDNFSLHQINVVFSENIVATETIHLHLLCSNSSA